MQAAAPGLGHPKQKYRLGGESTESSPEENMRVLLDKKLNMTEECVLAV